MNTIKYMKKGQRGFTLIELLVVIGILAILLAIVIIAINPGRQFAQSRDTKRKADVLVLLNAIEQYLIASATMPCDGGTCVDTTLRMIGTATTNCAYTCKYYDATNTLITETASSTCLNIAGGTATLTPRYIASSVFDPVSTGTPGARTLYAAKVLSSAESRVVVAACSPELDTAISVLR